MRAGIAVAVIAVLLAMTYWFATGGIPDRKPAEWLTAQAIAHRGQWAKGADYPENSLAAFRTAAANGYAVELDVQLTADGRVVVFHDDDLKRMTGTPGLVKDTSYAEIRELHLAGGTEHIPTLYQALRRVNGRTPVFVEIKNRGDVGELEDKVAEELLDYRGKAAVISFNPYSLERVASKAPSIPRGQLSSALKGEDLAFYEVFLLRHLLMNWKSSPDFIAYDLVELPSLETRLQRRRGRPLIGWTAESAEDYTRAKGFCDAVICNPEALP